MKPLSEREIACGLRDGRVDAWHALYEGYSRRVWAVVARIMGPGSADVADVVQETFLAAARSARGYDPERGSLWVWLWGIARRHVALHFRKQERQDRLRAAGRRLAGNSDLLDGLDSREDLPSETLESAELAVLIRGALAELPAEYGALLTARYLDGASVERIAAEDGASVAAVRSKLARARRAFREILRLRPWDRCCEGLM